MSARGSNLVLLPGLMCDHRLWDFVVEDLSAVADVSFGDLFRDPTIGEMADRVLAQAPETFAIAGFSMGGYIARDVALRAPDRVSHLALLNTSARRTSDKDLIRNRRMIELASARPFTGMAPASLKQALHPDRGDDQALLDHIQAMARGLGKDVFLRQMGLVREDGLARLNEITCPTLVVTGDADRLRTMTEAKELAEGIFGASLAVVPDCGHMTPLEQPARLVELMTEWLADA